MSAQTIEDARASGRINGAMATVVSRALDESGLTEIAAYACAQEPRDGGHAQRVVVATTLGLFDWRYEWPRHQAWTAAATLTPWAALALTLQMRSQQYDERGSATRAASEWQLRIGQDRDPLATVSANDTTPFLAFARACLEHVSRALATPDL